MNDACSKAGWGLLALGLSLGSALVASTWIFSQTVREIKSGNQTIEVSGFSQRIIDSDSANWRISFRERAATLAEANARLDQARKAVVGFMTGKGAKQDSLYLSPLTVLTVNETDERGRPTTRTLEIQLTQAIVFSSPDVELVARMAETSSDLVGKGIEIAPETPNFYYTKLDDLKIAMLGEAAVNARERAELLATKNKSGIGPLRAIHQGVFQITSPNSNEVTDYGVNDVKSKSKMIKAVVTVQYAVAN